MSVVDAAGTRADSTAGQVNAETEASPRYVALDGLRGIAIISVLFYHAGISQRGLFGVDVFFVVSGFFVTLLLSRELHRHGWFDALRFYGRRVRRIFPALAFTLIGVLVMLAAFGTSAELERAAASTVFGLLQVENWHAVFSGRAYWDGTGAIIPLGQLWSLSVTEQFYLVWPASLALLFLLVRGRARAMFVALVVMTVASALVAPLLFRGDNFDRMYFGSDTRMVAFIAGAAAAAFVRWQYSSRPEESIAVSSRRGRIASILGVSSLAGVVALSVAADGYRQPWLYQGGIAAVAALAAVLTASLCFDGNILARPLRIGILGSIGRVSLLVFLLHLPVYWALQRGGWADAPGWAMFLVGGSITLLLCGLVHVLFTEPLRLHAWTRASGIAATAAGLALVLGVAWGAPRVDVAALLDEGHGTRPGVAGALPVGSAADGIPRVVVVGDSTAVDFATSLAGVPGIHITDLARGGCGLMDPEAVRTATGYEVGSDAIALSCLGWQSRLAEAVSGEPDLVLVHNGWDAADQLIDGVWVTPCEPAWQERFTAQMRRFADIVAGSFRTRVAFTNDLEWSEVTQDRARMACFNSALASFVDERQTFTLLDWNAFICPTRDFCRNADDEGRPLFYDGSHFTRTGLDFIAPWLVESLVAAQRP